MIDSYVKQATTLSRATQAFHRATGTWQKREVFIGQRSVMAMPYPLWLGTFRTRAPLGTRREQRNGKPWEFLQAGLASASDGAARNTPIARPAAAYALGARLACATRLAQSSCQHAPKSLRMVKPAVRPGDLEAKLNGPVVGRYPETPQLGSAAGTTGDLRLTGHNDLVSCLPC